MDYYKIFNPDYNYNYEKTNYIDDNRYSVYSIETFFSMYPDFNSKEYKIFNQMRDPKLSKLNGILLLVHYHLYGVKNNFISSIKEFYKIYQSYDIIFYKLFYKNLIYNDDIYYLIDYYNDKNDKIISMIDFKNKYNIDYDFLRLFYTEFINKNDYDIAKILINEIAKYDNDNNHNQNNTNKKSIINKKYILSNLEFIQRYPTFNLNIYKLLNNDKHINNNDIQIKSYWYHIGQYKDQISSLQGLNDVIPDINLNLYRSLYNINNNELDENLIYDIFRNRDTLIYSNNIFVKTINDFNFLLFSKHYPSIKSYSKEKIIDFYIQNIHKINNIYSEKIFYIKYPNFNLKDYCSFNNIKHDSIKIYNEYNINKNKELIITSVSDFFNKYPNFDLAQCKKILSKKNILFPTDNEYLYYWYNNQDSTDLEIINNQIKSSYKDFNMNIYKKFNKINDDIDANELLLDFTNISDKSNIIYSIETFYNLYRDFDKDIYCTFNSFDICRGDNDIIIDFSNKLNNTMGSDKNIIIYSLSTFFEVYNQSLNIDIYRELNKDLSNMTNKELIIHWYINVINSDQKRIYSIETFYKKYPHLNFNSQSVSYNFRLFNEFIDNENDLNETNKIIYWMKTGIYNYMKRKNKNIVGHDIVNDIYEVLLDLECGKSNTKSLEKGISLIIRAKNEELNLKYCIETVVDLVDEIIFVDNNSTDETYKIMQKYANQYNNIKLYQYNINVSKVGVEHEMALKTNNMNTLGTFYNWCLSKATRYNVFKWDADFICVRNNFKQLVDLYDLREREDKFAIWFTGKTIFEDNNKYYLNDKSFYNEYRIFSYKNGFKWYNGNTCEYTEPYINVCDFKYKYIHPLFYEIKRTSIDEFMERSSMIDSRDINDFNILNKLKTNNLDSRINAEKKTDGLIYIDNSIINLDKRIIIFTPSLNFGGGNQFVVYMYNKLKTFGFQVKIIPAQKINKNNISHGGNPTNCNTNTNTNTKFNSMVLSDIDNIDLFNIDYINKFKPNYIIFNSNIPFDESEIEQISNITRIIFVTHSDVAYSNYFVEKYNKYIHKIVTVNLYTIKKLTTLLKINITKFFKIINIFDDLNNDYRDFLGNNTLVKSVNIKNKKFGVIARFSEDKNIPMFIYSLLDVFKKYPDYKCYLVGTDNQYYDNYLKYLCELLDIKKYISFEGYQDNVFKYYKMFDFIVLPSVSEGCAYNIIEAMSLGKPVITSDVGGNHELIKNNINGFIYQYKEIKEFESKTTYIKNYNEQLSLLGYFTKSEIDKNYINNNVNFNNIEVNIPYFISCSHCKNIKSNTESNIQSNMQSKLNKCTYCLNIKRKIEIFNTNMINIQTSIIKMIELKNETIELIQNNNQQFIKKSFNQDIYIRQILDLIK